MLCAESVNELAGLVVFAITRPDEPSEDQRDDATLHMHDEEPAKST